MNIKNVMLRISLLGILFSLTVSPVFGNEENVFIYYQSGPDLIRIDLSRHSTEVVASALSGPVVFSPDHSMGAYRDPNGEVWISEFDLLDFQKLVITEVSLPAYGGLFWTPDSQSLIFSYASPTRPDELPDQAISYMYDPTTGQVEEWRWGDCSSLVRHRLTGRIALKCEPIASHDPDTITSTILAWGGEQQNFIERDYEVLLDDFEYPGNFDWYADAQTEQVVFTDTTNYPAYDIFVAESGNETRRLGVDDEYTILTNIVSVSPDRSRVAYMVECNDRGPRHCLQISDLTTAAIIWDYESTIFLASSWRLAWAPESNYVVMLGTDRTRDAIISVLNTADGTSQDFSVGYASGNLVVSLNRTASHSRSGRPILSRPNSKLNTQN